MTRYRNTGTLDLHAAIRGTERVIVQLIGERNRAENEREQLRVKIDATNNEIYARQHMLEGMKRLSKLTPGSPFERWILTGVVETSE